MSNTKYIKKRVKNTSTFTHFSTTMLEDQNKLLNIYSPLTSYELQPNWPSSNLNFLPKIDKKKT